MKTPKEFQPANFLKRQGFAKSGDGYINPLTKRKLTKSSALNKAAKVLGWKSFDTYKSAFTAIPKTGSKQTPFDRFEGFAKSKGRETHQGSKFFQLFKAAYQTPGKPFKPRSKELTELLTYVGKRNKRTKHFAGESPRKAKKKR